MAMKMTGILTVYQMKEQKVSMSPEMSLSVKFDAQQQKCVWGAEAEVRFIQAA